MGDVIPFMLRQMLAKDCLFIETVPMPQPSGISGQLPDPWGDLPSDCNPVEGD